MKINKDQEENINIELEYMHSLHSMNKNELILELMSQRNKALDLQAELDTMKFVLADASEDFINVPLAQRLIRENKQKQ